MKTIEDRAEAYYEGDIELLQTRGWLDRSDIADIVEKAYIQGATEQKAIDDELLKRAHKGVLDKAIKEKKKLIDKACEWLEDNCKGYFMCDKVQVYNLTDALRKAMEG